ncbi:103aa long hypothetical protein [Pyrococcus horikoshii OT3]|uniref:Uncharacterized protein n=1 Tax=Pyrococcus horikoshii (strain ATCC 700860 / DSM 12428 / JCM 9974 / NBRC 100139 / OT-3) TaxID=70601 RepID=O58848_PYRHO|nr:103aa long hypothetical protein [Pyrococcus horikoshii OT3]
MDLVTSNASSRISFISSTLSIFGISRCSTSCLPHPYKNSRPFSGPRNLYTNSIKDLSEVSPISCTLPSPNFSTPSLVRTKESLMLTASLRTSSIGIIPLLVLT